MTTVSETSLASTFLTTLGAPDTPVMEKAVIAWMRKESGGTILGNNPWNMRPSAAAGSGVPTCGTRTSTKGSGQFAVFCNPQDGARAAAKLLLNAGHDWRNYDLIVAGARSGQPSKFFQGLVSSAWSGTRYGGNTASLTSIYNGLVPKNQELGSVIPDNPITGKPGTTGTEGPLCAWASGADPGVCFNIGHVFTANDTAATMAYLSSHNFFAGDDPQGTARQVVNALLRQQEGKPWNDAFLQLIAKESGIASGAATITAPGADILTGVGSIVGKVVGFAGGMVLIILGVFLYSKSIRNRVIQEGVPV